MGHRDTLKQWKHENTVFKSWWWKSKVRWWKVEITKPRWWKFDIISCFHHRTFNLSPLWFCIFNFSPLYFRLFIIVISTSYFWVFFLPVEYVHLKLLFIIIFILEFLCLLDGVWDVDEFHLPPPSMNALNQTKSLALFTDL